MQTKLTLRMDRAIIERAKAYAEASGKSLSQIVADYFTALDDGNRLRKERIPEDLPPVTRSLYGILKGSDLNEEDYRKHLQEKYG